MYKAARAAVYRRSHHKARIKASMSALQPIDRGDASKAALESSKLARAAESGKFSTLWSQVNQDCATGMAWYYLEKLERRDAVVKHTGPFSKSYFDWDENVR